MGARRPDSCGRRLHARAARRRVDADDGAAVKRMTLASAMGLSAFFVTISLAGLFGSVGEALDAVLTGLLGVAAWGVVLTLGYSSVVIARGKSFSAFRAFGDLVIIVVASAFAHLISDEAGGVVGEAIGDAGVSAFSLPGTFIMGLSVVGLVVAERIKMLSLLSRLAEAILSATSEPSFPYPASGTTEPYSEPALKPIRLPVRVRVVTPSEVPETRECVYEPAIESSVQEPANASKGEVAFETDDTMPASVVEQSPKSTAVASIVRAARTSSVVVKFALPSTKLLSKGEVGKGVDEVQLQEEGELLVSTLASYNVKAKLEEIVVGPSVVTFEASIAVGTKLRTVMGLADDIALAFGSRKVRIVPSRLGRVAFEIAREVRAAVSLRELIEDAAFASTTGLPVILGRGMRGECVAMNLAEAPHALVAGATGSGKSVGLNAMLISLLMRCSPDELRMICIDPKQVELAVYSRLPHMLAPIISDPKEAVVALKWAVSEMERRYELLSKAGVKNIAAFNSKAGDKLPLILVVIDEYADLFAVAGKEVEGLVARLAQKSRAAGLHVIVATQRPSVDVLSGVIKANFPMRVAFRTAQKNDGRVILDESGSEALLGRGDMLARLNGVDALVRVQGPMVSEAEIEAVVGHWCNQSMPRYDASVLAGDPEVEEGKSAKARKDAAVKVWS
jgi:DNA segregation ATPase FtsK/SpoIIIE-like protein